MGEDGRHRLIDVIAQPAAQLVFIVGCPRSGTTWVMDLLDSHEDTVLATPAALMMKDPSEHGSKESRLFAGPAFDEHCQFLLKHYEHNRALLLAYAHGAVQLCELGNRSGKPVILEKTPSHIYRVKELAAFFPNSKFVYVMRDGRDTCLSMLKAGESWGADWAPKTMEEAAKIWADSVAIGAPMERAIGKDRWLTIRYEHLLGETEENIIKMFNFIGLTLDHDQVKVIRDENAGGAKAWFEGLYRKGKSGQWKEELSQEDLQTFNSVAGDHLAFAGYK